MTRTSEEHRGLGANIVQRLLQAQGGPFCSSIGSSATAGRGPLHRSGVSNVGEPSRVRRTFSRLVLVARVYVVEGLGQTAQLLATLDAIKSAGAARQDAGLGLRTLDALDAVYSLRPGATPPEEGLALLEEVSRSPVVGLASRIDVRLLEPVLPGCRLDYRAEWTLEQNGVMVFDVEASVSGRPVVRGELGASVDTRIPRRSEDPKRR